MTGWLDPRRVGVGGQESLQQRQGIGAAALGQSHSGQAPDRCQRDLVRMPGLGLPDGQRP